MSKVLKGATLRAVLNKIIPDANAVGAQVITVATNASPSVITIAGHGLSSGDVLFVAGTTGNTAINGLRKAVVIDANTFSMTDFFTAAAVNGNGVMGGSPTAARIEVGIMPDDCVDLIATCDTTKTARPGTFPDSQRPNAAEVTIASVFLQ